MNFSTNQVRNFYVINSKATPTDDSTNGAAIVKSSGDDFYLRYKSPGGVMRSDLIKKSSVSNLVAKKATDMRTYLKRDDIAIDAAYLSGTDIDTTKVPVGTELMLRINLFQWGSLSPEDQYVKYGTVGITTGISADQFYRKLAENLKLNSNSDSIPLFDVKFGGALGGITFEIEQDFAYTLKVNAADSAAVADLTSGVLTITPKTAGTAADINTALATKGVTGIKAISVGTVAAVATATALPVSKLILLEKAQPWVLGKKEAMPLQYKLIFTSSDVYSIQNGINRYYKINWCTSGTTETTTTNLPYIGNGQMIADMEWFCMGERGDDYRMMGYPNNIDTKYLIDPSKEYNVVDFDFKYMGSGVDNQESVKHMTLVFNYTDGVATNAQYTLTNTFIGDLETATGLTLADLS